MGVTAVFFTVFNGFPQIRLFRHLIINTFGGIKRKWNFSVSELFHCAGWKGWNRNHYQTRGGHPCGRTWAVFWMADSASWVGDRLCGVDPWAIFKKKIRGEYVGGPAFYIRETGLGWKKTAAVYAQGSPHFSC